MKKLYLILLCLPLSISTLFAQKITGVVTDDANKPQEFATVMLMRAKDSALVKGAITDDKGAFEIENIAAGQYFTKVSMIGFKNFNSKVFDFDGTTNRVLETIPLSNLTKELSEVTVTAAKPLIEIQADKLVFNVDPHVHQHHYL